jgi:exopolysaccharide biosynthesis polyprenyl glycosylphosphotransferase
MSSGFRTRQNDQGQLPNVLSPQSEANPSRMSGTWLKEDVETEAQPVVGRVGNWARLSANEWRDALLRRMLAASDILAVAFGGLSIGFLLSNNVSALFWTITLAPFWVLLAKLIGLYDRDQRSLRHLTIDEVPLIATWALAGAFGMLLFLRLPVPGSLSLTGAARLMLTTFVAAFVLRGITRRLWRYATPPERTAIIGSRAEVATIRRKIELFPEAHLEIVAELPEIDIESLRNGDDWWRSIDRIVVSSSSTDSSVIVELSAIGQAHQIRLSVIPLSRSLIGAAVQMNHIVDLPVLEYRTWNIPRSTLMIKRALDIAVSAIALVLFLPIAALIALAIKLDSHGPVFFSQIRAGRDQRPFRMYKFRTMVADAEERLQEIVPFDKLKEPMFKLQNDPRITRVGRLLRRSSLDEMPQLFNVLKGEMSLVGPRPEQFDLVERYSPEHLFRLSVKPGMTGPMQVNGRGVLTFDERLSIERTYIENLSLAADLRILVLTVGAVFGGRGAL